MSDSKKQQPTLEEELREEPTRPSALPSLAAARTHEGHYKRFSVGDMVVECLAKDKERFGIILDMYRDFTFSVRFVLLLQLCLWRMSRVPASHQL